MSGGAGGPPKRTKWMNYPKRRCLRAGCKKRVRGDGKFCKRHSEVRE